MKLTAQWELTTQVWELLKGHTAVSAQLATTVNKQACTPILRVILMKESTMGKTLKSVPMTAKLVTTVL